MATQGGGLLAGLDSFLGQVAVDRRGPLDGGGLKGCDELEVGGGLTPMRVCGQLAGGELRWAGGLVRGCAPAVQFGVRALLHRSVLQTTEKGSRRIPFLVRLAFPAVVRAWLEVVPCPMKPGGGVQERSEPGWHQARFLSAVSSGRARRRGCSRIRRRRC